MVQLTVEEHGTSVRPVPPSLVPEPVFKTQDQRLVDEVRKEIDGYYIMLKRLHVMPPEEVFYTLSSITARVSEIRTHLWRSESRRLAALRSREIDPLLEEADRQFRLMSRHQAVRQMEWDAAKGQM